MKHDIVYPMMQLISAFGICVWYVTLMLYIKCKQGEIYDLPRNVYFEIKTNEIKIVFI